MFSGRFSTLGKPELSLAFKSLDIDREGTVAVSDIIEVLLSYSATTGPNTINLRDLNKVIPGIEAMSPRSRIEELIQYIICEFKKINMVPMSAFKMAITNN